MINNFFLFNCFRFNFKRFNDILLKILIKNIAKKKFSSNNYYLNAINKIFHLGGEMNFIWQKRTAPRKGKFLFSISPLNWGLIPDVNFKTGRSEIFILISTTFELNFSLKAKQYKTRKLTSDDSINKKTLFRKIPRSDTQSNR